MVHEGPLVVLNFTESFRGEGQGGEFACEIYGGGRGGYSLTGPPLSSRGQPLSSVRKGRKIKGWSHETSYVLHCMGLWIFMEGPLEIPS